MRERPDLEELVALLAQSQLCRGMSTPDVAEVVEEFPGAVIRVDGGEEYASEGASVRALQVVLEGRIHATMVGASGRQIRMDTLEGGRILAPALIFASSPVLPVRLVTDVTTLLYILPTEDFERMLECSPLVRRRFIALLSDISSFLMGKIQQLTLSSLTARLASYLLRQAQPGSDGWLVGRDIFLCKARVSSFLTPKR